MADDVTLPGTGAVVATDDIGSGRQAQLIKPVFGDDGSATMVSATNPMPTSDQPLVISGSVTSATNIIGSTDCSQYTSFRLMIPSGGTAQVAIEFSNDNSSWTQGSFMYTTSPNNVFGGVSVSTSALFAGATTYYAFGPIFARYVRVRVTSYTSGTIACTLTLLKAPSPVSLIFPVTNSSGNMFVAAASGATTPTDTTTNSTWTSLAAMKMGYIGGGSQQWARERMPNIFKSVTATASGNTAVWTPTASRKVRLLKVQFFATSDAATSGGAALTVKLQDATTDIGISVPVYVPATGGTTLGGWTSGPIDLGGFGFMSAAANNVLNVNLSAALTAGSIGVIATGTEE